MEEEDFRRNSYRWKYWDYSSPGSYFITICTQGKVRIFGQIADGQMTLSENGVIVAEHLAQLPAYHKRVILEDWVVMPDHIHLIVTLGQYGFDNGVCKIEAPAELSRSDAASIDLMKQFYKRYRRRMLIPKIIGKFKAQASTEIRKLYNMVGLKVWQRNYYDHVIRDKAAHEEIRRCIIDNPKNWLKKNKFDDKIWYDGDWGTPW